MNKRINGMRSLKEALISKDNRDWASTSCCYYILHTDTVDSALSFHKAFKDKTNLFKSMNGIYYIVFPETKYPKLKNSILSITRWMLFKTRKSMKLDDIYKKLNTEFISNDEVFELIDMR